MLNDVMTLPEASVIWCIKYEGLVKCITAGPLDQPKFRDDEWDKIQDTWVVTRQAMERLFGQCGLLLRRKLIYLFN